MTNYTLNVLSIQVQNGTGYPFPINTWFTEENPPASLHLEPVFLSCENQTLNMLSIKVQNGTGYPSPIDTWFTGQHPQEIQHLEPAFPPCHLNCT